MALQDKFHLEELKNASEELVFAELERALKERGILDDQTNETILDMSAFALNKLKPFYRTSLLGRMYGQALSHEYGDEVKAAVEEAILKINASKNLSSGSEISN